MLRPTPIYEYEVKKLRRRQPSIGTAGAKISWSLSGDGIYRHGAIC